MRGLHDTRTPKKARTSGEHFLGAAQPAARFGFHVLEMCAVMCIGGGLLIVLFFGAATLLGFSDLREQDPELSALIIAVILAGAMVGWMRFRGMEWRPTLEMAGSSIAAGMLLIAGSWVGLVPESALVPGVCGLACVAMVIVMLFRVGLYSSSHTRHHGHAAA